MNGVATYKNQSTHILNFILAVLSPALLAESKTGILAKQLIVSAAISSDWGRNPLAREHNNYFARRRSNHSRGYRHYDSMEDSFLDAARGAISDGRSSREWNELGSLVESVADGVRGELRLLSVLSAA